MRGDDMRDDDQRIFTIAAYRDREPPPRLDDRIGAATRPLVTP